MYFVFDCETTGLWMPDLPPPRLVQVAWQLHDPEGRLLDQSVYMVRPDGFEIPYEAARVHGISTERATKEGLPLREVLPHFEQAIKEASYLVGHNLEYDLKVMVSEYEALDKDTRCFKLPLLDTMSASAAYVGIKKKGGYKFPKLMELYQKVFDHPFPSAHRADFDVAATAACFFHLLKEGVIKGDERTSVESITYEAPAFFLEMSASSEDTPKVVSSEEASRASSSRLSTKEAKALARLPFVQLHVHSQHSIIPSTLSVGEIVELAQSDGHHAVALCDMGNLCGAFSFVKEATQAGILPIVGCELFFSEHRKQHKFTQSQPDRMFRQPFFARSEQGYRNLTKLSTLGYIEGLYGMYPRIDKELLSGYTEGLLALSGGLEGELPQMILKQGKQRAEEALSYWRATFGDDFYIEILRHGSEEEEHVNQVLLEWAQKYELPILPAQEVFYARSDGQETHDTLLCIKDRLLKSAEIGTGRGKRPPLVQEPHHFCSKAEMYELFSELPNAFEHLSELIKKIEPYELSRSVMLPAFSLPDGFGGEDDYLRHLSLEGLKQRYTDPTQEAIERLEYELSVIKKTGFAGYFLIIHEIVTQARRMNIFVGPGRGSVAGALVAYVLKITEVDPLKYGLMFERFLNPERISMPDIDIDFDDERRDALIEWVSAHYGSEHVAQISTYGTMAARSSIRDCARVLEMPLEQADQLARTIPAQPGYAITIKKALSQEPLKSLHRSSTLNQQVLTQAQEIEGMIRNIGTHACGLIIAPKPLIELVPLMRNRDDERPITQYDNSVVEEAGLLKMDFLGLRTLSILRSTLEEIKVRHQKEIDLSHIPLNDAPTYRLFQRAQTSGIFQFESIGMQRYLRQLKPDRFEDLIAMNALYRPGPMDYISSFIERKHKREQISYDLPEMEEILSETYGITVYQEQVMLLSELLAGFSKSEADTLRYAMGKKNHATLHTLKSKFLEGFAKQGHPSEIAKKIWKDWEAFASYAFNKSHATCYSLLAYHTAYLRANYPAEYMSAVLTHHQGQVDKVAELIEECRSSGIQVLPPDVNHSKAIFSAQEDGTISFGLSAIKGLGQSAAEMITEERTQNGKYNNIFDLSTRLPAPISRGTYQALAKAGAFDSFPDLHRKQYLEAPKGHKNVIEQAIKWGLRMHSEQSQAQELLFSGDALPSSTPPSTFAALTPYTEEEIFAMEKETVGIYVSKHPLDELRTLIEHLSCAQLKLLSSPEESQLSHRYRFIGSLVDYTERKTKKGTPYGQITVEDLSGSAALNMWRNTHKQYEHLFLKHTCLYIEGHFEDSSFRERRTFEVDQILSIPKDIEQIIRLITLELDASTVTPKLIDQLEEVLKEAPKGSCQLRIYLRDEETTAQMHVKKYQIRPTLECLSGLEALDELHLRINTQPQNT